MFAWESELERDTISERACLPFFPLDGVGAEREIPLAVVSFAGRRGSESDAPCEDESQETEKGFKQHRESGEKGRRFGSC